MGKRSRRRRERRKRDSAESLDVCLPLKKTVFDTPLTRNTPSLTIPLTTLTSNYRQMVLIWLGGGLGYFNQPGALAKSELLENHNRNFWDFANFTTLKSFCISKTASTGLKSISIFRCTQKMGVEQQMDVEQKGGEPTLASHGLKKG